MKNKIIFLVSLLIIVIACVIIFLNFDLLFSSQYNKKGISHFLVVTIDKSQSKEYIGVLDSHKIYVEGLNLRETNFRNINAENVSIKKAIDEKLVSISEWKKFAWLIKKEKNEELLKYDNYEIACTYDECIIRPLSK